MIYAYRGHTVKATCESFKLSKDAGFKVVSHMMPDLPNVGLERDIDQFVVCCFHCRFGCFGWLINCILASGFGS